MLQSIISVVPNKVPFNGKQKEATVHISVNYEEIRDNTYTQIELAL